MAKVILKFDKFGNVNADAVGFSGKACEDATNTILAGIGRTARDDKKPEYHATESASAEVQLAAG